MRIPLTIAIAAALLVTAALAIEPPKDKPATPTAAPPPAPSAPAAEAPAAPAQAEPEPGEELEELPPLPPDVVDTGPPPQRFTPTEKVRADFPVSYPIDI